MENLTRSPEKLETMNDYCSELESIEPHVTIDAKTVGTLNDSGDTRTVFIVGDSGLTSDVSHRFGDYEASFDLTDFGNSESFVRVLEDLNLHPVEEYFRLSFGNNEANDRYVYLWANSEGMIVAGNNPITGDYSDPEARQNQPGYASYIGIEGTREFVDSALVSIVGYADYYNDIDKQRRSFI